MRTINRSSIKDIVGAEDNGTIYDTDLTGVQVWISDLQPGAMVRENGCDWEPCEIDENN